MSSWNTEMLQGQTAAPGNLSRLCFLQTWMSLTLALRHTELFLRAGLGEQSGLFYSRQHCSADNTHLTLRNRCTGLQDAQTSARAHCAASISCTKINWLEIERASRKTTNKHQTLHMHGPARSLHSYIIVPWCMQARSLHYTGESSAKWQLRHGQWLWWCQWQTQALLTCAPFLVALLLLPRVHRLRFDCFPLGFFAKISAGWSGGPGSHTGEEGRRGEERRGGAGSGRCRRCAGWLPREDTHKDTGMEASASRYVEFVLKGNATKFVEDGSELQGPAAVVLVFYSKWQWPEVAAV